MCYFSVDIEADGPAPGLFSMVQIGIVRIDDDLKTQYLANLAPISDNWKPDALAACNLTREETLEFDPPEIVIPKLITWVKENNRHNRAVFVSDNPGFDFGFFNWYSWAYADENPFGYSARRIGDIYSGAMLDLRASSRDWHKFRKTKHTHNALDDAMGNAEALKAICQKLAIKDKVLK